MTPEERLKKCSICKKRKMDMQRGLVCRLTDEKAAFEEACNDFETDDVAEEKEKELQAQINDPGPVTGWLTFFLWVGMGGGSIMTLVYTVKEILANDFSFFLTCLYAAEALILMAIAAYAIYAFYKRRPNAVAVAKTYIAMILIDAVIGIWIMIYVEDFENMKQVTRQFIWVVIWYSYLTNSTQVERRFPVSTRIWGAFEKNALILYSISCATILMMVFVQPSANVMLRTDSYIRQAIEASQSELPIDIGDGVLITGVKHLPEDHSVCYDYRLVNCVRSDFDDEALREWSDAAKEEILQGWAAVLMTDEFFAACCGQKMTMVFNYYDRADEFLFKLAIAPEDYEGLGGITGLNLDDEWSEGALEFNP